tara:strand:+ start:542 stop:1651 length:1110 start_codon:yes stop_codon:yes gene_type:complete
MKVAFDHHIFTLQSYGGLSRYINILAKEFFKKNIEIKAFTGMHQNKYILDLPTGVIEGRYIKQYPLKAKKIFYLANHCISQIQIKNWKPDIIHETYYSALPIVKTDAIRVVTVADMIHELFQSHFSKNNRTAKRKREAFNRADHIFSISNHTKNDLIEIYGIDKSKISVIHLGVDVNRFHQQNSDKLNINSPYILYVGERGGYKNFDRFIKACAQSKTIKNNIKILAFGGGAFSHEEILAIRNLGFKENSIMHVAGDDKVLASLYSNAICFVYPSLYEGFGLPPLEAMASGCPVVSSNTSSMPEVINQAGEFFDPSVTEDICCAIEKVINSGERRKELIELGYKNVNLFSWDKCVSKTIQVYKELIVKK